MLLRASASEIKTKLEKAMTGGASERWPTAHEQEAEVRALVTCGLEPNGDDRDRNNGEDDK